MNKHQEFVKLLLEPQLFSNKKKEHLTPSYLALLKAILNFKLSSLLVAVDEDDRASFTGYSGTGYTQAEQVSSVVLLDDRNSAQYHQHKFKNKERGKNLTFEHLIVYWLFFFSFKQPSSPISRLKNFLSAGLVSEWLNRMLLGVYSSSVQPSALDIDKAREFLSINFHQFSPFLTKNDAGFWDFEPIGVLDAMVLACCDDSTISPNSENKFGAIRQICDQIDGFIWPVLKNWCLNASSFVDHSLCLDSFRLAEKLVFSLDSHKLCAIKFKFKLIHELLLDNLNQVEIWFVQTTLNNDSFSLRNSGFFVCLYFLLLRWFLIELRACQHSVVLLFDFRDNLQSTNNPNSLPANRHQNALVWLFWKPWIQLVFKPLLDRFSSRRNYNVVDSFKLCLAFITHNFMVLDGLCVWWAMYQTLKFSCTFSNDSSNFDHGLRNLRFSSMQQLADARCDYLLRVASGDDRVKLLEKLSSERLSNLGTDSGLFHHSNQQSIPDCLWLHSVFVEQILMMKITSGVEQADNQCLRLYQWLCVLETVVLTGGAVDSVPLRLDFSSLNEINVEQFGGMFSGLHCYSNGIDNDDNAYTTSASIFSTGQRIDSFADSIANQFTVSQNLWDIALNFIHNDSVRLFDMLGFNQKHLSLDNYFRPHVDDTINNNADSSYSQQVSVPTIANFQNLAEIFHWLISANHEPVSSLNDDGVISSEKLWQNSDDQRTLYATAISTPPISALSSIGLGSSSSFVDDDYSAKIHSQNKLLYEYFSALCELCTIYEISSLDAKLLSSSSPLSSWKEAGWRELLGFVEQWLSFSQKPQPYSSKYVRNRGSLHISGGADNHESLAALNQISPESLERFCRIFHLRTNAEGPAGSAQLSPPTLYQLLHKQYWIELNSTIDRMAIERSGLMRQTQESASGAVNNQHNIISKQTLEQVVRGQRIIKPIDHVIVAANQSFDVLSASSRLIDFLSGRTLLSQPTSLPASTSKDDKIVATSSNTDLIASHEIEWLVRLTVGFGLWIDEWLSLAISREKRAFRVERFTRLFASKNNLLFFALCWTCWRFFVMLMKLAA